MTEITPDELGRQLMKPTGEIGLQVGENMNVGNIHLYNFVLSKMNFKNNSDILEVGFGNGKFIQKFFDINSNIKMSAIDYSETMCSEARVNNNNLIKTNKLIIKCEDSKKMSFPDESFDNVVTINTIYFWYDFDCCLQEIRRVLKNTGQLYIGYRPKSIMENLSFTKEVFLLYESAYLQDCLRKNGFRIIEEDITEIERKSIDGTTGHFHESCLIAEKI